MPPSDKPTLIEFYRSMARARAFELLLLELWEAGSISGELHLGTGEEAVAAAVAAHLTDDDALALDHRSTPFLLLRGVDPVSMVREMLGRPDGLCGGQGGHMHLFSRSHRAATSGIVGASVPLGCGFALAATRLRPGGVAVATLGDGAMNQGMVMEALNLAAVWSLPLVTVCKDNDWAITTESHQVTAGDLASRAEALGVQTRTVDGGDPDAVHQGLAPLFDDARAGSGPGFLLARCPRLDDHMADFPLGRAAERPIRDGADMLGRIVQATWATGSGIRQKAANLGTLGRGLARVRGDRRGNREDPLARLQKKLDRTDVDRVDAEVRAELEGVRNAALAPPGAKP